MSWRSIRLVMNGLKAFINFVFKFCFPIENNDLLVVHKVILEYMRLEQMLHFMSESFENLNVHKITYFLPCTLQDTLNSKA